jgi:hypothetical protein
LDSVDNVAGAVGGFCIITIVGFEKVAMIMAIIDTIKLNKAIPGEKKE